MAIASLDSRPAPAAIHDRRALFSIALASVVLASFALASFAPIGFSIATVFLFAGPHNWLEGRYMLSRMPARWGPLAGYFTFGIAGVVLLTLGFALLPNFMRGSYDAAHLALASWNTLLLAWIAVLAMWRSQQNPRRNWGGVVPLFLALAGVNWLWPWAWSLALVYGHPLVAIAFFDREIARRRPEWLRVYRAALLLAAGCLALMLVLLGSRPDLLGDDLLSLQIARHAGADVLSGVSTHFLVAAHTFLEMLHYAIWIAAMPLLCVKAAPWDLSRAAPLARRSKRWRGVLLGFVAVGGAVVLLLWCGFAANYPLTRDLYFTVAMLHVLAEVPFLLRLL